MTIQVKSIVDEVADYLESLGYGTVGSGANDNIGKNFMKNLPDAFIGVYSTGGPKLDIANRIVRFQILVRDKDKSTAFTNACNIYDEFNPNAVNVLATIKGKIEPDSEVGNPFLDEKKNTIYSLNFTLRRTGY